MISAHATHPGLVRQNNEDFIRTDDTLGIYLLADGIGGHNAGEVASALAIETVYTIVRANIMHTAVDEYFELLTYALCAAHWEINSQALTSLSYLSMGTTLVIAVVRDDQAYIVHAGDSRCYLYQNRSESSCMPRQDSDSESDMLKRLTRDHTVGAQLLANGVPPGDISKKQYNTLTQSIGCGYPPTPDFNVVDLKQGDVLLLCSDGLTDMLADTEIETIIKKNDSRLDTLATELIDAANANGGRDNISVVLVKPKEPSLPFKIA